MFHVNSEVGALKQVVLHEPGLDFERLTPANKDELLDDVVWVARAQEEHRAFQALLRERGVTVHLLHDLLAETVKLDEAVDFLFARVLDDRQPHLGAGLAAATRAVLAAMGPHELATHLLGGLNKRELTTALGERHPPLRSLGLDLLADDDFILPPLPNSLFTRDSSCWVYDGVSVNPMAKAGRKAETVNYEAVYTYHPMFAEARAHRWIDGEAMAPAADVEVIGNGAVLVGLGERTTPAGVEILARRLFRAGLGTAGDRGRAAQGPGADAPGHGAHHGGHRRLHPLLRSRLPGPALLDAHSGHRRRPRGHGEPHVIFSAVGAALELDSVRVLQTSQDSYLLPSANSGTTRLQPAGPRARHGRRLRGQRGRQPDAGGRRHRGAAHPGRPTGPRPRRPTLHELPRRTRRGLTPAGPRPRAPARPSQATRHRDAPAAPPTPPPSGPRVLRALRALRPIGPPPRRAPAPPCPRARRPAEFPRPPAPPGRAAAAPPSSRRSTDREEAGPCPSQRPAARPLPATT
ncbi:Arginine deiminase [Streptomyces violaceorubidus]